MPEINTATAADVRELLDQLDQAHAAATRGAWEHVVDDHGPRKGVEHSVWDDVANRYIVETLAEADAALIVAAVNALTRLTAALRAALDKHRPIGGPSHFDGDESDYCDDDGFIWPCSTYRALTAALTPGAVTAGAPGMSADVTTRLAEALAEIGDRTLPPRILAARLLPVVDAIARGRAAELVAAVRPSPSAAEEALARVEAMAERAQRHGYDLDPDDVLDAIRAAIAAPVAQAGEGR